MTVLVVIRQISRCFYWAKMYVFMYGLDRLFNQSSIFKILVLALTRENGISHFLHTRGTVYCWETGVHTSAFYEVSYFVFLQLLKKYESLFDGTFGNWKTKPVSFQLKEGVSTYQGQAFPGEHGK